MKLGIVLPQHHADPEALLTAAAQSEEAGLDSVWVADHLMGRSDPSRPILDGWAAVCAVAARVDSLEVGTLVMRAGLRLPLLVTKMFETLDSIAPGRVTAGLGIGDTTVIEEQAAFGIPIAPRKQRVRWIRDTIGLLRERAPRVQILVGGKSKDALVLAVAAGGWNFWGPAGEFVRKVQDLRALAGGGEVKASWAGSFPGEDALDLLAQAGADHAMVAVGVSNYLERIEALRNWAGTRSG